MAGRQRRAFDAGKQAGFTSSEIQLVVHDNAAALVRQAG
jgi:hypothetical protein